MNELNRLSPTAKDSRAKETKPRFVPKLTPRERRLAPTRCVSDVMRNLRKRYLKERLCRRFRVCAGAASDMLQQFDFDGESVTSIDLKALLISSGLRYPDSVYQAVSLWARLEPPTNLYACNCLILPGEVAVHLQANEQSPFALDLDSDGKVCLFHLGSRLAEVTFPKASAYYAQSTSAGNPFGSIAVLEGRGTLAFFYMWRCQYIQTKETCPFCFQVMADMAGYPLPSPTYEEAAEIIGWAIDNAGVQEVQLTAGTLFASAEECKKYAELLNVVENRVGLDKIASEIYCYMTAPKTPELVDQVFEAGADRVAHDLHVWDRKLHSRFAPGHARSIGRDGQLRALEYIAQKYGPNKAFSAFVAGLEPLESMLEGAEYLASRGIVPACSVWMPTPGSVSADCQPPGLDYYQKAQKEFARLYKKYDLKPPGAPAGSHVSICHDIYRNMDAILAA